MFLLLFLIIMAEKQAEKSGYPLKKRIYLDNASTSFPKAPPVAGAITHFLEDVGCNVGRGSYDEAYSAAEVVIETRERLARLFGSPKGRNVIFTKNITESLNFLIKGLLKPGDHVLVSALEHNATMRPMRQMEAAGVTFSRIPCSTEGQLDLDALPHLLQKNTRAIFTLHASNVCGAMLPADQLGQFSQAHGLFYILDTAQTAGVFPLDMPTLHADAIAFTGHKSLLGPQGIGGFVLTDALAAALTPLLSGGTGSLSDSEDIPPFLPDRFEPGTLNLPGIYGLHAALGYLKKTGLTAIRTKEQALAQALWLGLAQLPGIRLVGGQGHWKNRAAIVSANFTGQDNAEISYRLAEEYGVLTRCGLHCAPNAHKTLGTFPQGTVRFSPGHCNSEEEIDFCLDAVRKILA